MWENALREQKLKQVSGKMIQGKGIAQIAEIMGNQAVIQRVPVIKNSRRVKSGSFDDEEKRDGTYRIAGTGFMDAKTLRGLMKLGTKDGGEVHHIIPRCLVRNKLLKWQDPSAKGASLYVLQPKPITRSGSSRPARLRPVISGVTKPGRYVDFNKPWNGILLPGKKGEHELKPTDDDYPYHRKSGCDHPEYTKKVKRALSGCNSPDKIRYKAGYIKDKILDMKKGEYIDDIIL